MASRLLTQEQVGEIFSFYSNFGRSSAVGRTKRFAALGR